MDNDDSFKILIVDDKDINIIILSSILCKEYVILTANCGQEALRMAKESNPALILLDIILPDISGFEVLAALKESAETKSIPVIFVTGLDSIEDEERGFGLGAVDYITKPFHPSIVSARVKTHLRIVQQIRTIEKLSMMDPLIEIPNRRSFDRQMDMEWYRAAREGLPISLLMLDIDNFKEYNDKYGHLQGDLLLLEIAKVFKHTLRRPGDFVARLGGEEFAVLLPNIDLQGAVEVAERIRKNVEGLIVPFAAHNVEESTSVTVSIGVNTERPAFEKMTTDFIALADKMLYAAKNSGKNCVNSDAGYFQKEKA